MGFFSDIQEEARREARQSRYQTGQTEDAAPVQNIQSKGERKPETTQPAPTPMPEPKQPAPAVTPMDDGEVMAASVKRIRADIERITRRKGYQHERRTKNVPHDGGTAPALSRTPVCRESAPGD